MGCGAEPVESDPFTRAGELERPITDNSGAQERCRLDIAEPLRHRQAKARVRDQVRRITAVARETREDWPIAEILLAVRAVEAAPIGAAEPRNTNPVAVREALCLRAECGHAA